jgi:hypothetical protein
MKKSIEQSKSKQWLDILILKKINQITFSVIAIAIAIMIIFYNQSVVNAETMVQKVDLIVQKESFSQFSNGIGIEDFLENSEVVEETKQNRKILPYSQLKGVSIPSKDGVFLDYGENINTYLFSERLPWNIEKIIILRKGDDEIKLMQVTKDKESDDVLFLIEEPRDRIDTIPETYFGDTSYIELEGLDRNSMYAITQMVENFSRAQEENVYDMFDNIDQTFGVEEILKTLQGRITQSEEVLIRERLEKLKDKIISVDRTYDYYHIDIGSITDSFYKSNAMVVISNVRQLPNEQLQNYKILSDIYDRDYGVPYYFDMLDRNLDDSRFVMTELTKEEYRDWVNIIINDPTDLGVFSESEDLSETTKDFLDFTRLVNKYNENSGLSIEEYVQECKDNNQDIDNEGVFNALEQFLNSDRKDTLKLAEISQKNLSNTRIINPGSKWPDRVSSFLPKDLFYILDKFDEVKIVKGQRIGRFIDGGGFVWGDFPLKEYWLGDLIMLPKTYSKENDNIDIKIMLTIGKKEINGEHYLLVLTIKNSKIAPLVITEDTQKIIIDEENRGVIIRSRP